MANVNVSVLIPLEVYIKFIKREIRPSDLKMVLQPGDLSIILCLITKSPVEYL